MQREIVNITTGDWAGVACRRKLTKSVYCITSLSVLPLSLLSPPHRGRQFYTNRFVGREN